MDETIKTRLPIALAVLGALLVGACAATGCSAAPDNAPDYVLDESNINGAKDPAEDKNAPGRLDPSNSAGESGPVTVEETTPGGSAEEVGEPSEEPMAGDAGAGAGRDAGAATKPTAPTAPTTVTKSQSCTSRYGSHSSITKLTWTLTGTKITIKSMTVQVQNTAQRSENDVDVYIRPPGGAESFSWNSGDILADNRIVTVPYRSSTTPKSGTKVRILTNFDEAGGDPYASCTITVL